MCGRVQPLLHRLVLQQRLNGVNQLLIGEGVRLQAQAKT